MPLVTTVGTAETPSGSNNSVCVLHPPSKESIGIPVLDLTSSPTHVDDIVERHMISPMEPETLTRVLHCKGIVHSQLPYDTLWECTPLIDGDLGNGKADWVSVGAMMTATHSGRIREEGKEDKLIQRPSDPWREYAVDKLIELLKQ